jgi:hypothetical protein
LLEVLGKAYRDIRALVKCDKGVGRLRVINSSIIGQSFAPADWKPDVLSEVYRRAHIEDHIKNLRRTSDKDVSFVVPLSVSYVFMVMKSRVNHLLHA